MDIAILSKLSELKKQEISSLRNDYITLDKIVNDLRGELEQQEKFTDEFIRDYADNIQYNVDSVSMLNGRIFLRSLNIKNKGLVMSKQNAELQKNAALVSLKEAMIDQKKLTKIIIKERKLESIIKHNKELLIDDTLEITRYNRKALPV